LKPDTTDVVVGGLLFGGDGRRLGVPPQWNGAATPWRCHHSTPPHALSGSMVPLAVARTGSMWPVWNNDTDGTTAAVTGGHRAPCEPARCLPPCLPPGNARRTAGGVANASTHSIHCTVEQHQCPISILCALRAQCRVRTAVHCAACHCGCTPKHTLHMNRCIHTRTHT